MEHEQIATAKDWVTRVEETEKGNDETKSLTATTLKVFAYVVLGFAIICIFIPFLWMLIPYSIYGAAILFWFIKMLENSQKLVYQSKKTNELLEKLLEKNKNQ